MPPAPRKLLRTLLAVVGAIPTLVVIAWFAFTHHSPWTVPAEWRPTAEQLSPSTPGRGLSLRFLGVSGYEITDGVTTLLIDPTPTRPSPSALLTGPLVPDEAHGAKLCPKADFIFVNHTHFDHALDVPAIALRTGAVVLGSKSTVNLALSRGVPASKVHEVHPGDHLTLGTFTVDVHRLHHTDILGISNPMHGVIPADAKALWFWEYRMDSSLGLRLEAGGSSIWFHPTSTFTAGEISGAPAETLIVGVTGEKLTAQKVKGLLAEVQPKRVLPSHFDNFFQPVQRGLALMPGLDLPAARKLFLDADPKLQWITLDYDQPMFLPPDAPRPGAP